MKTDALRLALNMIAVEGAYEVAEEAEQELEALLTIATLAADLNRVTQAHNALPVGPLLNGSLAAVREARNNLFAAIPLGER